MDTHLPTGFPPGLRTTLATDTATPRGRRKRRVAVLALRLPRFLPHAVPGPAEEAPAGHACNTELTSSCVYGCPGSSSTWSVRPVSTISPARITAIR